jgi:hypothetical protein
LFIAEDGKFAHDVLVYQPIPFQEGATLGNLLEYIDVFRANNTNIRDQPGPLESATFQKTGEILEADFALTEESRIILKFHPIVNPPGPSAWLLEELPPMDEVCT